MSNEYQIGVIVGSLRTGSYNKLAVKGLVKLFPSNFTFKFLDIGTLPLYNPDSDSQLSDSVETFKSQIAEYDGIIFTSPEYNRSIIGVLKNAIEMHTPSSSRKIQLSNSLL
ncbi:NAD(P)H-dependent FMN reductase [Providencia alcalifaciens]|nr:NAD(P)H-dependent FMN reductase [Providencia alcalifaciens]